MPKHFFAKELVNNPYVVDGKAAPFQVYPGNTGLLELETGKDDKLIAALDEAAAKHRGGIVKLTEPQFAEKKNQLLSAPLPKPRPKEMLRTAPRSPFDRKSDTAGAGAEPVKPLRPTPSLDAAPIPRSAEKAVEGTLPAAPVEGFRPPTRRIKRAAASKPESPVQTC